MVVTIISIFFSLVGLYISYRIFKEKNSILPMVCPLDSECETVLESKYAKFAGIGLEYGGMFYYGTLLVGYISLFFIKSNALSVFLFLITVLGFIFSIYLTAIQAFALKKWCTWCLGSAITTTIIFLVSGLYIFLVKDFFASLNELILFIDNIVGFEKVLIYLKNIGLVVGFASAFINDLLTLKFLKDFKIEAHEDQVLLFLSNISWLSIIAILIPFVSYGIGIKIFSEETFLISLIILSVIILNELVFRTIITPKLIGQKLYSKVVDVRQVKVLRVLAFVLNIVSVVAWVLMVLILLLDFKIVVI